MVCRSVRGPLRLQGNLKSEHLLLMWFTVCAEAEQGERVKGFVWKDRYHLELPSLPLLVSLPVYPALLLLLY